MTISNERNLTEWYISLRGQFNILVHNSVPKIILLLNRVYFQSLSLFLFLSLGLLSLWWLSFYCVRILHWRWWSLSPKLLSKLKNNFISNKTETNRKRIKWHRIIIFFSLNGTERSKSISIDLNSVWNRKFLFRFPFEIWFNPNPSAILIAYNSYSFLYACWRCCVVTKLDLMKIFVSFFLYFYHINYDYSLSNLC